MSEEHQHEWGPWVTSGLAGTRRQERRFCRDEHCNAMQERANDEEPGEEGEPCTGSSSSER